MGSYETGSWEPRIRNGRSNKHSHSINLQTLARQVPIMDGESCVLTVEAAQNALKRLGRHPITLQHAMLELALAEKNLSNIDDIARFPNVMHLNISKNKLSSLSVLSNLPTLVELNARYLF